MRRRRISTLLFKDVVARIGGVRDSEHRVNATYTNTHTGGHPSIRVPSVHIIIHTYTTYRHLQLYLYNETLMHYLYELIA